VSTLTVAAGLGLAFATSAFLAYAGDVVRRRPLGGDDRLAGALFAVWWYGAALVILNQGVRTLFALGGIQDPTFYFVQGFAGMIPLAAAVWGLTYYMVYLLSGRRGLFVPITAFYVAYLVYLFWFSISQGVASVAMGEWQALVTPKEPATTAMNLIFGIWLAGPVLFAVGAYVILSLQERDPTLRYRLTLVSSGFLLLFGIVLIGYLVGWVSKSWFPLAYQVPALIASILAVAAYRPPAWIQRRWGIQPLPAGDLRAP
jgi:hypothetical protein